MIAWLALLVALLSLSLTVLVLTVGFMAWRRVAPTVTPLLSMLAPSSPPAPSSNPWPPAPSSSSSSSSDI